MCEAGTNECYSPTCWATEQPSLRAATVFLKEPESYPDFRPICGKACRLDLSKIRTPSSISLTITRFDSASSSSRFSFQWKGVPGLRKSRKGSIRSVILKAYETWLMSPNQDRMSVMFLGCGKSIIALRNFLHGLTLSAVISKSANSTVSCPKMNFSGLRVMPFLPHISSQLHAWKKLSSRLFDQRSVSSMHLVLFGTSAQISSNRQE